MSKVISYLNAIPAELHPQVQDYVTQLPELLKVIEEKYPNQQAGLIRLLASSQFAAEILIKENAILLDLLKTGDLQRPYAAAEFNQKLDSLLQNCNDEANLTLKLRQFRRREMLRIAWRDLVDAVKLEETMTELSNLADTCVQRSLTKLNEWQSQTPLVPQEMLVIACGKLGAKELNFSSDIDLIFVFQQNQEGFDASFLETYYVQLARKLIRILSTVTPDGFVFRVDLRLRPFGHSGPLLMSLAGIAAYYYEQGRDWERYALAKARIVTGNKAAKKQLQQIIRQFVYRHYVDYSVIEALRRMKQLIQREAQIAADDIKRGSGGIREIEFIAQVVQLIRGGKEPWLQQTAMLKLLPLLAEKKCMPTTAVTELLNAYIFLRRAEHHLQAYANRQTQTLPKDEIGKVRLAFTLGLQDSTTFAAQLQQHRQNVVKHFDAMIQPPTLKQKPGATMVMSEQLDAFAQGKLTEAQQLALLHDLGIEEAAEFVAALTELQTSFAFRNMDTLSRKRLQQITPIALPIVAKTPHALITWQRVLLILESTLRRSAYLVLLLENPQIIPRLIELVSQSQWMADQFAKHPFLLDELMSQETLYSPYSVGELENELRQFLLAVPENDLEQQMEGLRRFKLIQLLRVTAADIKQTLPIMKISDHLTQMADAILHCTKDIAWQYLIERHGYPCEADVRFGKEDFVILAYGKLGGIELGYGSDLDLVFLRADMNGADYTDGAKSITNAEFFVRLGQRIIHILNTQTFSGILYQIDVRLRPSGSAGLLVAPFGGFATYQHDSAWTWEHQALVRARVISGSQKFRDKFKHLRLEILSRQRDKKALIQAILEMRGRMRTSLEKAPAGQFDLDQGGGGIKDIEFITQYLVLYWSYQYPSVGEYTDNIRILLQVANLKLLPESEVELLMRAYKTYRAMLNRCQLQDEPALVPIEEVQALVDGVQAVWNRLFRN